MIRAWREGDPPSQEPFWWQSILMGYWLYSSTGVYSGPVESLSYDMNGNMALIFLLPLAYLSWI